MIEFIGGVLIGGTAAGIVGRGKFLQVQNKLRDFGNVVENRVNQLQNQLIRERNLNEGLTLELADKAGLKTAA